MTEREISIVDAWVEKGIEFYVKYRPVFDILPLNLFDEEDLYGVYVQPDDTLSYVHPTVAQWKEKIKLRGRDFFKDVDLTDDVVQWIIGILDVRMGIVSRDGTHNIFHVPGVGTVKIWKLVWEPRFSGGRYRWWDMRLLKDE